MEIAIATTASVSGISALYAYFQTKKLKQAEARTNIGEAQLKQLLEESDMQVKYIYKLQVLCTEFKQSLSTFYNRQFIKGNDSSSHNIDRWTRHQYILFKKHLNYKMYKEINDLITKNPEDNLSSLNDNNTLKHKDKRTLWYEIPNDDLLMITYAICGLLSWIQIKKKDDSTIHAYTSQNGNLQKLLNTFVDILNINNDHKISIPIILQKNLGEDLIYNETESSNITNCKYNIIDCMTFKKKMSNRYLLLNRDNKYIRKSENEESTIMNNIEIIHFGDDDTTGDKSDICNGKIRLKTWGLVMSTEKYNNWINNEVNLINHLNQGIITQFNKIYKYSKNLQTFLNTDFITNERTVNVITKISDTQICVGFINCIKMYNIKTLECELIFELPLRSFDVQVVSIVKNSDKTICGCFVPTNKDIDISIIELFNISNGKYIREINTTRPSGCIYAGSIIRLLNEKICYYRTQEIDKDDTLEIDSDETQEIESSPEIGHYIDIFNMNEHGGGCISNTFKVEEINTEYINNGNILTQFSKSELCYINDNKVCLLDITIHDSKPKVIIDNNDKIIQVVKLMWSKKKKIVCTVSKEHIVKIWNATDNFYCIKEVKGYYHNIITIYQDIYIGAIQGKNIYILDIKRDRIDKLLGRYTLNGHTRKIKTMIKCSDYILSGSYDNTIKIWKMPNFYRYENTILTSINDNIYKKKNKAYIDHYIEELLYLIFTSILYYKKKSIRKSNNKKYYTAIKNSWIKLNKEIKSSTSDTTFIVINEKYKNDDELINKWILFFSEKINGEYTDLRNRILPILYKSEEFKLFENNIISSNPNIEDVSNIINLNTNNLSILNRFYKNELLPIHNDLIEIFKNILYEFIFRAIHKTLDDLDNICSELITESGKILKIDLIKRQKLLG